MIRAAISGWMRRAAPIALCLAVAGCATPQRIASGPETAAFDRTGRFAVSVSHASGKQDAVQGGFAWHDAGEQLRLDLANPMGSTLARVDVTPGSAVLTRSDGSQERASHPDELVDLVLGSPIPVRGLRDWLRGQTGPAPVQDLQKEAGHISAFVQQGWRVRLSRYDDQGPRLLQMNRNDAQRTISVRLVVDSD